MTGQKTQARNYHTQQVHYLRGVVKFSDAGNAVEIGRVPDKSIMLLDELAQGAFVTTAFDGGGTDLLDIGYAAHKDRDDAAVVADPNNMGTAIDISSAGWKPVDEAAGADRFVNADGDGLPITATYTDASSDSAAGELVVVVAYIPPDKGEG